MASSPDLTVALCHACHDALDGRIKTDDGRFEVFDSLQKMAVCRVCVRFNLQSQAGWSPREQLAELERQVNDAGKMQEYLA